MVAMISAMIRIACYFVYLPLIANQSPVDHASAIEQAPVVSQNSVADYRVYLPLILNQSIADNHDCITEHKVYLPYIVADSVPGSQAPAVKPPEIPAAFPSGGVHARLRNRGQNHLPGSTVVGACGQMHEVTIEFSPAYQKGRIDIISVEKEMKYGQSFDLLDPGIRDRRVRIESRDHVNVTLVIERDGAQFIVAAPATTSNPALIADETLMDAGYCQTHSECETFKRNDTCHGYLSWDILFS